MKIGVLQCLCLMWGSLLQKCFPNMEMQTGSPGGQLSGLREELVRLFPLMWASSTSDSTITAAPCIRAPFNKSTPECEIPPNIVKVYFIIPAWLYSSEAVFPLVQGRVRITYLYNPDPICSRRFITDLWVRRYYANADRGGQLKMDSVSRTSY